MFTFETIPHDIEYQKQPVQTSTWSAFVKYGRLDFAGEIYLMIRITLTELKKEDYLEVVNHDTF